MAHPSHLLPQGIRHRAAWLPRLCDLREMPSQDAHALEVHIHPQHGHDRAQIPRHRLLARDQIHRLVVELGMQPLDRFQRLTHRPGLRGISIQQRRTNPAQGRLDQPGQHQCSLDKSAQLRLIHLTHGSPRRRREELSASRR